MTKVVYKLLLILLFTSTFMFAGTEVISTEVSETRAVALSDNNKLVAYGSYRKIFIIDAETKKLVQTLEGAEGDVHDIVIAGDRLIATGGKYVGIWNLKTGKAVKIAKRDEYTYTLSVCRKTGRAYVGGTFIEGWDIKNGKSVMKSEKFSNEVESFAVSPDGKSMYVSVEWSNSLLILDAGTGRQKEELTNISRARDMLFHPDGKSLFISQFGQKVKQINLKGEVKQEIGPPMTTYGQLSISPKGKYLLMPTWSTQRDIEQVLVYNIRDKKLAGTVDVSDKSIYEAEMTSNTKTIIAAPKDDKLHFISFTE